METNELTSAIIGAAIEVHRRLGPGLLESAYRVCLAYELRKRGFNVIEEQPVPVVYDEIKLECGFRADLIVNSLVVVEVISKPKFAINTMAGNLHSNEGERRPSHAFYPVTVAPTTAAEYDRVQDGPKTFCY